MSWKIVCIDAFKAAQNLKAYPRSCISRAYYAAYAAAAYALVSSKGVVFALGRDGPGHEQLPNLVGNHLATELDFRTLKMVKKALRRLYSARLQADYKPNALLSHLEATQALLDANTVLLKLGML
jgi:uncharacterized protein (UPF0332 family)